MKFSATVPWGFLRVRTREVRVATLSDAGAKAAGGETLKPEDAVALLQKLAPAEGVGAFLMLLNWIGSTDPEVAECRVLLAFSIGLVVSAVVTTLGVLDATGSKPPQLLVGVFRLCAYVLFCLLAAGPMGVTVFDGQSVMVPALVVLYIYVVPIILKRLKLS